MLSARLPGAFYAPSVSMLTHSLDPHSLQILKALIGTRVDQIVWDINAVYLVEPTRTTKIEADNAIPEWSGRGTAEVFPITVRVLQRMQFAPEGESRKIYRVMAENVVISNVELVRVGVQFGPEKVVHPSSITATQENVLPPIVM